MNVWEEQRTNFHGHHRHSQNLLNKPLTCTMNSDVSFMNELTKLNDSLIQSHTNTMRDYRWLSLVALTGRPAA